MQGRKVIDAIGTQGVVPKRLLLWWRCQGVSANPCSEARKPDMSVDAATVRRIAHLARIAVKDEEVEHLKDELNGILAFVEQLSEVNVEGDEEA
jgi:hypothetical protein